MTTQQQSIAAARVATEKTAVTAATPANAVQLGRLNRLEVMLGECKVLLAQINASGGVTDSASQTAITNLLATL